MFVCPIMHDLQPNTIDVWKANHYFVSSIKTIFKENLPKLKHSITNLRVKTIHIKLITIKDNN